jgi:predicted XRE-type DNA-binding protein
MKEARETSNGRTIVTRLKAMKRTTRIKRAMKSDAPRTRSRKSFGRRGETTKRLAERQDGVRSVTPAGRSVFFDLFEAGEATELERSMLLMRLQGWLSKSGLSLAAAARSLRVDGAQIVDIQRGRFRNLNLATLIRLSVRSGLGVTLNLTGRRKARRTSGNRGGLGQK